MLNWDKFGQLAADPTKNWESLCRELIRRNYSRFGSFRSVSQQPGVEFNLLLEMDCDLGCTSEHWGWQCRWYGANPGRSMGSAQRGKIEKSIATTEKYYPDMSHWVLWTRHSLTPNDQKWFYALNSKMKLRLWTAEEVVGLTMGDASCLRSTYFGDLILTKQKLQDLHELAIAPIRKRWEPLLHVEVETESKIHSILTRPGTWPSLNVTSRSMAQRSKLLSTETLDLKGDEFKLASQVSELLQQQSEHLTKLSNLVQEGTIDELRSIVGAAILPSFSKRAVSKLAARLRSGNHRSALSVSQSIGEIGVYFKLLREFTHSIDQNFYAVIGDAGFGKTYLAAELTKVTQHGGGILLMAKYLPRNGSIDDFVKQHGFCDLMDDLINAVDAAGARMGRRIPIVIDGLNESERPLDWRDLLEKTQVKLNRVKYCVLVVTLRSSIADKILPQAAIKLRLNGFQHVTAEAIRKYFNFYKIRVEKDIPWEEFYSPLFLSIFCQATNPNRKHFVGPEHVPRSPIAAFEKYRALVVNRISESLDVTAQNVECALRRVAMALWNDRVRTFDLDKLREIISDASSPWQNSLTRALEDEGVLSRNPVSWHPKIDLEDQNHNQVSAIIYDGFAGFMIADAILTQVGVNGLQTWFSENAPLLDVTQFSKAHPLAEDIVSGFAGLLPLKPPYKQFWTFVDSPLREAALLEATRLEGSRIDDETLNSLKAMAAASPKIVEKGLFERLSRTVSIPGHPLNADFLDSLLREWSMNRRDLRWTEWIRRNRLDLYEVMKRLTNRWKNTDKRDETDRLLAVWAKWMLPSTVRYLRDQATKSLVCYGRFSTKEFFQSSIDSLSIDDPYISERMIGATYGILMSWQTRIEVIGESVGELVNALIDTVGPNGHSPTNHWITRLFIKGIFDFSATFLCLANTTKKSLEVSKWSFKDAPYCGVGEEPKRFHGYIGSDFENYEVGRFFEDRGNYDFRHEGYSNTIAEIRTRVHLIGYQEADFKSIDDDIGRERFYSREPDKTERYAKKYGWIGYYEKAGVLASKGMLSYSRCDGRPNPIVDIDPSFPDNPPKLVLELPDWQSRSIVDQREWLASGEVKVPDELIRRVEVEGHRGPWLAVDGYLEQSEESLDRRTFAFIRGILVKSGEVDKVIDLLKRRNYLGNDFVPREPSDYYTFAGEIPWCVEFASEADPDELEYGRYKDTIGGHFQKGPVVELLSHNFGWESYHSSVNDAHNYSVPSKSFSSAFGLRSGPFQFNQYEQTGTIASLTLAAPDCCTENGSILYLREDLLLKYAQANSLALVWLIWGERLLSNYDYVPPDWCSAIYQSNGNQWRRIATHSEFLDSNKKTRSNKNKAVRATPRKKK